MKCSYPPTLHACENEEIASYWNKVLDEFLEQKEKAAIRYPDKLHEKVVKIGIEVLEMHNSDEIDYQYAALYLGNKKQLLIFKKSTEFLHFLSCYRLPKDFPRLY